MPTGAAPLMGPTSDCYVLLQRPYIDHHNGHRRHHIHHHCHCHHNRPHATTPGALPEGARNISTEFLQYIRHRLRNGTPSYDELTAPPQQLFKLMEEAWRHLVAKYDTELNDMWWSEAGVDVAMGNGYKYYPTEPLYYAVFGIAKSTDQQSADKGCDEQGGV